MTEAAPRETVRLRRVALYGKRDGAQDYGWILGPDAVPSALRQVCREIAEQSAATSCEIALCAGDDDGRVHLVRTFHQGNDNVFRPVVGMDVSEVQFDDPLEPAVWLRIAYGALIAPTALAGTDAEVRDLKLPGVRRDEITVLPQELATARLGLPMSTSTLRALMLLGQPWCRYKGVIVAPNLSNGRRVGWSAAFEPFLGVRVARPALDEVQSAALEAAQALEMDDEDWDLLHKVPPAKVWDAVRRAADGGDAPDLSGRGDDLWPWWLKVRSRELRGAALLEAVTRDLGEQEISLDLVSQVFPDLSDAARTALVSDVGAFGVEDVATWEELADLGFLGSDDLVPVTAWIDKARHSSVLTEQALDRLTSQGVNRAAGAFLLDLIPKIDPADACLELTAAAVRATLPWMRTLNAARPLDERLAVLGRLGRSRALVGDDSLAEELMTAVMPEADDQTVAFGVHHLSLVGPTPCPCGVSPRVVEALLLFADPVSILDGIFAGSDGALSSADRLNEAFARRLEQIGAVPPSHGYTSAQRRRHVPLCARLAAVPGWEGLSPVRDERVDIVRRQLRRLGLTAEDLAGGESRSAPVEVAVFLGEEG